MWLANLLGQDGTPRDSVRTEATVHLERVDGAQTITRVVLSTVGKVPGVDEATFRERAETATATSAQVPRAWVLCSRPLVGYNPDRTRRDRRWRGGRWQSSPSSTAR